jgi:glucose/arabinose dehydrogenase
VFAYPYDAAAGTVGTRKTLITGMSNGGHSTRTVWASKKVPDALIVAVGSNANIDSATSQQSSGRSQLRIFSIAKISQASVAYTTGEILGWGLRNSVGFSENPVTGGVVRAPLSNADCLAGVNDSDNATSSPSRTASTI